MSITAASTFADVKAEYLANASYSEDRSVTKARAFITACRALKLLLPSQTGSGSSMSQFRPDLLDGEIQTAQAWVAANDTSVPGNLCAHVSFSNFRQ